MEGLTVTEMVEILGLPRKTIISRIRAAGIVPRFRAGRIGLYDKDVVERIRTAPRPGRPAKGKE